MTIYHVITGHGTETFCTEQQAKEVAARNERAIIVTSEVPSDHVILLYDLLQESGQVWEFF